MDGEAHWCAKVRQQAMWMLPFEQIFAQFPEKDAEWKASVRSKTIVKLLVEYRSLHEEFSRAPHPNDHRRLPWMDYATMDVANHRAYEKQGL